MNGNELSNQVSIQVEEEGIDIKDITVEDLHVVTFCLHTGMLTTNTSTPLNRPAHVNAVCLMVQRMRLTYICTCHPVDTASHTL